MSSRTEERDPEYEARRRLYALVSRIDKREVIEALETLYSKHRRPITQVEVADHIIERKLEEALPIIEKEFGIKEIYLFEYDEGLIRRTITDALNYLARSGWIAKVNPERMRKNKEIIPELAEKLGYHPSRLRFYKPVR